MAFRQRTGVAAVARSISMDDPDFLPSLVERVVQAVLQAGVCLMGTCPLGGF
jgi:hypothetical protein